MNVNYLMIKCNRFGPKMLLMLIVPAILLASAGEIWPPDEAKRCRFLEDFDNDGDIDLLLSQPISSFGNAGGGFKLFLREGDQSVEAGMIFAHPRAVALEHHWKQTRIWTYQKSGGWVGMLGYYELIDGTIGEFKGIEVNPGDGGTAFGNQMVSLITESDNTIVPEWIISSSAISFE